MEGFAQRLQQIIDYYNLNAGMLADRLTIQRSTLSHLFAGRNRPGFEFLEKLLAAFPELNMNWVVSGKGEMIKGQSHPVEELVKEVPTLPAETILTEEAVLPYKQTDLFGMIEQEEALLTTKKEAPVEAKEEKPVHTGKRAIKVILLYSDGSMEEYLK